MRITALRLGNSRSGFAQTYEFSISTLSKSVLRFPYHGSSRHQVQEDHTFSSCIEARLDRYAESAPPASDCHPQFQVSARSTDALVPLVGRSLLPVRRFDWGFPARLATVGMPADPEHQSYRPRPSYRRAPKHSQALAHSQARCAGIDELVRDVSGHVFLSYTDSQIERRSVVRAGLNLLCGRPAAELEFPPSRVGNRDPPKPFLGYFGAEVMIRCRNYAHIYLAR